MLSKMWEEITHVFPNFNGYNVEICEWTNNVIPHFVDWITIDPYSIDCKDILKKGVFFILDHYILSN